MVEIYIQKSYIKKLRRFCLQYKVWN